MKIELVSVNDMWEELKNFDGDINGRNYNIWKDEDVFESVGLDEFVDDVNDMYKDKEGFMFRGKWFLSSFVNMDEMGVNVSLSNNYGEYVEREVSEE